MKKQRRFIIFGLGSEYYESPAPKVILLCIVSLFIHFNTGDSVLNNVFKDVNVIVDYIKENGKYEQILANYENAINLSEEKIIKKEKLKMDKTELEKLLKYFALKYDGDFQKIYHAIENKEQIDETLKNKLFSEVKDFEGVCIASDDYPEIFKIINCPPIYLFYKGDIAMIDKHYDNMSLQKFDNNSRAYTVIDIKSGEFFIAYESYNKAVELDKSMDMKRERVREMAKEYNELIGETKKEIELINSKSILDCKNDIDIKRHVKELSDTLDRLKPYENEICIARADYVDVANHGEGIDDTEMTLKELFDEKLRYYDLSRGTDFKIDKVNDVLILSCYGMRYEMDGVEHIKQIDIKVKLKSEDKSFKKLLDKEAIKRAIDKVHSLKR